MHSFLCLPHMRHACYVRFGSSRNQNHYADVKPSSGQKLTGTCAAQSVDWFRGTGKGKKEKIIAREKSSDRSRRMIYACKRSTALPICIMVKQPIDNRPVCVKLTVTTLQETKTKKEHFVNCKNWGLEQSVLTTICERRLHILDHHRSETRT